MVAAIGTNGTSNGHAPTAGALATDNVDAESALVGGLLHGLIDGAVSEDQADGLVAFVGPADFETAAHRYLWTAISALVSAGRPVTPVTLNDQLEASRLMEQVGGPSYFTELMAAHWNEALFVGDHAKIVRERGIRRRILRKTVDGSSTELDDLLTDLAAVQSYRNTELQLFNDQVDDYLVALIEGPGDMVRLGFPDLDTALGGIGPGNLTIIAARPGVGKSSMAIAAMYQLGVKPHPDYRKSVGFITLEMSVAEVVGRLVSLDTGISTYTTGRRSVPKPGEYEQIEAAVDRMRQAPVWIDDASSNLDDVVAKVRIMRMKYDIKVVFVDYLQLVSVSGARRQEARYLQIAEVTRRLKLLAGELDIPIVALAQLNRNADGRGEPKLSDLKESGSQEEDADQVIFLYQSPTDAEENAAVGAVTYLTGMVAKNRHGATGYAKLILQKKTARIVERAKEEVTV